MEMESWGTQEMVNGWLSCSTQVQTCATSKEHAHLLQSAPPVVATRIAACNKWEPGVAQLSQHSNQDGKHPPPLHPPPAAPHSAAPHPLERHNMSTRCSRPSACTRRSMRQGHPPCFCRRTAEPCLHAGGEGLSAGAAVKGSSTQQRSPFRKPAHRSPSRLRPLWALHCLQEARGEAAGVACG